MKLWILRPIRNGEVDPWNPWYDKAFGFVVRAETEERARAIANKSGGDEIRDIPGAWLDSQYSSCTELTADGEEEEIMQDFHSA